jgi:hypothetical protein
MISERKYIYPAVDSFGLWPECITTRTLVLIIIKVRPVMDHPPASQATPKPGSEPAFHALRKRPSIQLKQVYNVAFG